uniref:Polyketide_cyc domain-containing protein n=1 Tax=Trichuris muris TaxID=70415 RepID=A0A5S6QT97_TRIMR
MRHIRFRPPKGLQLGPMKGHSRAFFKLPEPLEQFGRRKHYSQDRKLGYSMEQMFDIAADVARYKEFVPWCIGSKVVRRIDERCNEVELTVGFPPIVERYVSTVTLVQPYLVKSVSSETRLFKQLISLWQFYAKDNDPPNTCNLSFSVMYEFQSPLHAAIASLFFEEVTSKMVTAFMKRARNLYGPPSMEM